MTTNRNDDQASTQSSEEAILALSNETRIRILHELGDAGEPVTFSDLCECLEIDHSGRFNYHLDKLVGHFIRKSDAGYSLRQPGQRVIEAIAAGTLTEDPVRQPMELDTTCSICETEIEMSYSHERIELYCPGCSGNYGPRAKSRESILQDDVGFVGGFRFPPTGLTGREPSEILRAGSVWANLEMISVAEGVCPRCAASVNHTVRVCEEHNTDAEYNASQERNADEESDGSQELCDQCDRRHAVQIQSDCESCLYAIDSFFLNHLLASDELRCFVAEHGIDPLSSALHWGWQYEEEVHSTDPFSAQFTFHLDGDTITLTVDDSLNVVSSTRC